jgi:hypothetical protein
VLAELSCLFILSFSFRRGGSALLMDCLRSFVLAKAMFLVLYMLVLRIATRSLMILCLSLDSLARSAWCTDGSIGGFRNHGAREDLFSTSCQCWGLDWNKGKLLHEADNVAGNNMRTSQDSGWSKYRHRLSQLGQHWSQPGYDYLQFC